LKLKREARITAIQKALIQWYRQNSRDLPWRQNHDPYSIWISEIMLQQTRVNQAKPYYERFMKRFRDVHALAAADEGEVLKAWEGMGYYSRARNMHKAAQWLVRESNGVLPRTIEELKALPGIGPYTAGAIASIAFDCDEPVLDGNVIRVLTRIFAEGGDPKSTKIRNKLWDLARSLVPKGKAGLFNQALMDLGAMVCLPRKPLCDRCPVDAHCEARARGRQDQFPRKAPRKAVPHQTVVAGVIWNRGKILIDRRKPEGLLGGLWEFPGGKREKHESLEEALLREIAEEVGIKVRIDQELVTVDHAYSHFKITLHAFECTRLSGRIRALGCDAVKWIRPESLDEYAFPAATHKVIAALRDRMGNLEAVDCITNKQTHVK